MKVLDKCAKTFFRNLEFCACILLHQQLVFLMKILDFCCNIHASKTILPCFQWSVLFVGLLFQMKI